MSQSNISETSLNLRMSSQPLLASEGLGFQDQAASEPSTPRPLTTSLSGDQTELLPGGPNSFPTKVIYFPEQWSDSVEILKQTQEDTIAAELLDCVFEDKAIETAPHGEANPLLNEQEEEKINNSELTAELVRDTSQDSTFLSVPQEQNSFIEAKILNSSDSQLTTSESIPLNESYQVNQNTEWFTLARKLRQQNRELIKTVVNLEQSLAESQHQLHYQKRRGHSAETLLTQQTQELTKTQQNLSKCSQELEKNQQTIQSQELIIDNLSQQLESSQQQAAQLERECAFLQQDNNEKTQKLIFLEQEVQELRSRLHRQQRYTLQYKAALDQCLEFPSSQINNFSAEAEQLSNNAAYQVTSKVTSIQAWSSNWQELPPVTPPDKSAELITHLHPETEFSLEESKEESSELITVSLDIEQEAVLEEENKEYITDVNLSFLSKQTNEDEVDILLDEFFASFEPDESVSSKQVTDISSNSSSPLSYSISPIKKPLAKIVQLPDFLQKSSH